MNCAILIKTKKSRYYNTGKIAITIGSDFSNEKVIKGLAGYTGLIESDFTCLSSSISYGIYGVKEHHSKFPIKRWLKGGAKNSEYAHTFKVKYIDITNKQLLWKTGKQLD